MYLHNKHEITFNRTTVGFFKRNENKRWHEMSGEEKCKRHSKVFLFVQRVNKIEKKRVEKIKERNNLGPVYCVTMI